MRGLAQSLFMEKEKRLPWKGQTRHVQPKTWPFLETLLKSKRLSYADYALAERLLRNEVAAREDVAALICHLALSARSGHLCCHIDERRIVPDPHQLWCDAGSETPELTQGELTTLEDLIKSGTHHFPSGLLSQVSNGQASMPLTPICRNQDRFYLQRNWVYEALFLRHWHRIEETSPTVTIDSDKLNKQLSELEQQKRLLPEQIGAIQLALHQNLTIITGGPGTGKTYTAGWLIKLFWENMTQEQRASCEIALAAPTGKAASNLQSSLKKALGNLDIPLSAPKTLHSLLGLKSSLYRGGNLTATQLSADLVLVDESSMIDVRLMAQLFAAIKPGARLILLGDRYQLPPVEAGGLFSDLITNKKGKIGELKTCLRAELKEIVELAEAINQGDAESTLKVLANDFSKGVQRFSIQDDSENVKIVHQALLKHSENLFSHDNKLINNPITLLAAFNRFRILSPLRQGPFGVDEINRLFLGNALKKASKGSWFMAPILIVKNDYRMGLLNGETGVLLVHAKGHEGDSYFQEGDYAYFPGNSETEPFRKIAAVMLPKFEYAYCLSVHKSQGSEFERVLLLNPKGSESFGREVLYTAVTRARKQLEIWSSDETLNATIAKKSQRLSGLTQLPDEFLT